MTGVEYSEVCACGNETSSSIKSGEFLEKQRIEL